MRIFLTLLLININILAYSQDKDPYEKYPSIKYKEGKNWKIYKKEKKTDFTLNIPDFFNNKDPLTLQITSFVDKFDSSIVRIFWNKKQIQKLIEPIFFDDINFTASPIIIDDINGDGLKDIKLTVSYKGCGLASMNVRSIYLFQKQNSLFNKISFLTKLGYENNPERDFVKDGNYEILVMNLVSYGEHNYWAYNLFNYDGDKLINVNQKDDYPILI
jgi:hypothetical protein